VNVRKIPLDPPFSKGERLSALPLFEKEGPGEIFFAGAASADINRRDDLERKWNCKN
jgi:hypothetical protein